MKINEFTVHRYFSTKENNYEQFRKMMQLLDIIILVGMYGLM